MFSFSCPNAGVEFTLCRRVDMSILDSEEREEVRLCATGAVTCLGAFVVEWDITDDKRF
jgi:hypothetical protein